jgi:hypothetical protein
MSVGIFWQPAILDESDHAIQKSAIAAKDAADAAKSSCPTKLPRDSCVPISMLIMEASDQSGPTSQ